MGRVVTVVAKPPDDVGPHATDGAIQEVITQLGPLDSPPGYCLLRAATVEDLAAGLAADLAQNGRPDLIQIIGHGMPGVLLLGYSWMQAGRMTGTADGKVYLLNSNPDWYGLLDGCVRKETKVWLLGCDVGGIGGRGAEVADGPTLLFDLAQMWACEVSAPEDIVDVRSDFVGGVYSHVRRLVRARGLEVFPAPSPADKAVKEPRGVGARSRRYD